MIKRILKQTKKNALSLRYLQVSVTGLCVASFGLSYLLKLVVF